MTIAFTKSELRNLWIYTARLRASVLAPMKPLTPEDALTLADLELKIGMMISEIANQVERGKKVFEWRISKEWAPTLNEFTQWLARQKWKPAKARKELGDQLRAIIEATPGAHLCGARKMRWVRFTRFTPVPKKVDDNAIDLVGGKLPLDEMKKLGILVDDSKQWTHREARVEKCRPGDTHVFVEVFECAAEEVPTDDPVVANVPKDPRSFGPMTKAIIGADAVPGKPRRTLPFGDT